MWSFSACSISEGQVGTWGWRDKPKQAETAAERVRCDLNHGAESLPLSGEISRSHLGSYRQPSGAEVLAEWKGVGWFWLGSISKCGSLYVCVGAGRVQPSLQYRQLYLKDLRCLHHSVSFVFTGLFCLFFLKKSTVEQLTMMNYSKTEDVKCQVDVAPKYVTWLLPTAVQWLMLHFNNINVTEQAFDLWLVSRKRTIILHKHNI